MRAPSVDGHARPAADSARAAANPAPTAADVDEVEVALPVLSGERGQDEEFVVYRRPGERAWRAVRVHDYPQLYAVPGLYEKVVYDVFGCTSPRKVAELLARAFVREGVAGGELSALDLGCGNGCVGEELAALGVRDIVGIDLCEEARAAAERDRPGLYREFWIGDLLALSGDALRRFEAREFDLLTCVAALGFGDIPPELFARALARVRVGGFVGFTIKDRFLERADSSGFARSLRALVDAGALEVLEQETYVHRKALNGDPLDYVCVVARVRSAVPQRA